MEKRTSAIARIVAALALAAAVLVLVAVIVSGLGGDSSGGRHKAGHSPAKEQARSCPRAKTYTVQTGDTLTAIAHRTCVPVAEIRALNPEVDPQILIAGQTLKLR